MTAKCEETKVTLSLNRLDGLSMAVVSLKLTVFLNILEKSRHAFLHNFVMKWQNDLPHLPQATKVN